MDLGASDEQLDCPFLYASAKTGHAVLDLKDTPENMEPLFEADSEIHPAPEGDPDADTQVLISTIDYNEYVGRIGVGKVESGTYCRKPGAYSSEPPRSGQKTEG